MSKRQRYGYEGAGVVLDLMDAKADTKHYNKYGKSVVPIGKNSEVYKGHSLMGNPSVTLRPRTSHFARMNKPQRALHEKAGTGKAGIASYFESLPHGKVSITLKGGEHPVLAKRKKEEETKSSRKVKQDEFEY